MAWHLAARSERSRRTRRRHIALAVAFGVAPVGVAVPALAQTVQPFPPPTAGQLQPAPPAFEPMPARPLNAVLIEHLCNNTLRSNEEDRLLGEISLAVRATIKYQGGTFSPDLIDDAVQEASEAITNACPQLAGTDDAYRLGKMIEIARATTVRLLADRTRRYSPTQTEQASAADLSQELTTREIDAWLDSLPPRQRAIALFLYASDVGPQDVSQAVGVAPHLLATASGDTKTNLLGFFREDPPAPAAGRPALSLRMLGEPPIPAPVELQSAMSPTPAPIVPPTGLGAPPQITITGISSDLYAGWSLLATVSGLPPDKGLSVSEPFLLAPDQPARARMAVTDAVELTETTESPRRFLLKAYAIDGDRVGAGLRDTLRIAAAAIDNPEARRTLANRSLSSIEIARCLWRDYGADDPGLCR